MAGKHRKTYGHKSYLRVIPGNYRPLSRKKKALLGSMRVAQTPVGFPAAVSAIAVAVTLTATQLIVPTQSMHAAAVLDAPVLSPAPITGIPEVPPTAENETQGATESPTTRSSSTPTRTPRPSQTIKPQERSEAPATTTSKKATPQPTRTTARVEPKVVKETPKPVAVAAKPAPKPVPVNTNVNGRCKGLGLTPNALAGCNILANALPQVDTFYGQASRSNKSCHPSGAALDLMVGSLAEGDGVNAFVRAHKSELKATTILWRVPNHFDHVHVSFAPCTN